MVFVPAFLDPQHLLGFLREVARASAWLVLITLLFLPLERLFAIRPRKFFRRSLTQDLSYYFINALVPGLLLATPLYFVALGAHYVVPWRVQTAIAAWPLWERVAVGFVVGEIGFYWGQPPEELRKSREVSAALTLGWLELFEREAVRRRNRK